MGLGHPLALALGTPLGQPLAAGALAHELAGGIVAPWTPLRLTGIETLYLGNDGKSLNSGEVTDWADLSGSRDLTEESSTQRPEESLEDSDMNGEDVLSFITGTSDTLEAAAAGDFTFWHSADSTVFLAWYLAAGSGTRILFDSNNGNTTALGGHFGHDLTNGRILARIGNGSTNVVNVISGIGSVTAGAHILVWRTQGAGYDIRVDGVSIASGALANSRSVSDASIMHVGDLVTSSLPFGGKLGALGFCSAYIPDTEVTELETYLGRYQP